VSKENSPHSSSEDIINQGLPQGTSPITVPQGQCSVEEELGTLSPNGGTPSSLTDRVLAMVNPRNPNDPGKGLKGGPLAKPVPVETVPTAFKWSNGGERVFVTGSFNNWQGKIMMHRNEHNPQEFVLVLDIPPGTHQYKFIVDEQWRLNEASPTVQHQGVTNNVVEVKRPVFEHLNSPFDDSDDEDVDEHGRKVTWGQRVPSIDEYSANPLKVPPHLNQHNIILNKEVPNQVDPYVLSIPGHELLNHLFIADNGSESGVVITAITQRFRTKASISVTPKFVTLIYYKPSHSSSSELPTSSSSTGSKPS